MFFLFLHLMIDIFQIHWYFGSARCKKQQKQYVFAALLQTPHKVLCKMEGLGGGLLKYHWTTLWFVFSIAELSAKLWRCLLRTKWIWLLQICRQIKAHYLGTCTFRSSSNQWKRRQRHFSHFHPMKCESCEKQSDCLSR